MFNPLLNFLNRLSGLDRRRTRHAADALLGCFGSIAQVRIRLGQRLTFHGLILADQRMARESCQATGIIRAPL